MKILFVQPDSKNHVVNAGMHIYNFEPLGLYYLASTLKCHHDVSLLDLNNEAVLEKRCPIQVFSEALRIFGPDVVAFSALTSVRTGRIKQLAKLAKEIKENVTTVVGGAHASLYPSDFNSKNIDVVITENSIATFSNVIRCLEEGCTIQDVGKNISSNNLSSERVSLNDWPKPYRKLGEKYRGLYRLTIGKPGCGRIRQPVASIKTSSGCPFRCNFCCLWTLYPRYETRQIDSVVEEIACLEEQHIFFADDESFIDVAYMGKLADALIRVGLKKYYVIYARADSICENPLLLGKLANAGLKEVWIGIEGSTDGQLEEYRKKNTTESHKRAVEICRKNGISIHATALVDYRFRDSDFNYMLEYTKEILRLTSCHFFVLTPFKGTSFYSQFKERSPERFATSNSDHFSIRQSVLEPDHMSIDEFHERYANLQKDFNSSTIPFDADQVGWRPEYLAEFESLRRKNERLHQTILCAHQAYKPGSTNAKLCGEAALVDWGEKYEQFSSPTIGRITT